MTVTFNQLTAQQKQEITKLNVDPGLTPTQCSVAQLLIEKHHHLFASISPSTTGLVMHEIDTENHRPINCPPYRASTTDRKIIQEQVDTMLAAHIISPSKSPWASPIVLVKKKDGTTRFCNDYRKLNDITIKDAYPLPRIGDSLAALKNKTWFSSLDLLSGYHQIPMHPQSKMKTAFICDSGLYEYNVMSFGLTNAPLTIF